MGEAEPFDRETLTDVPATAAVAGDASACTVGPDSAHSEPADLGAENGDVKPATLQSTARVIVVDKPGSQQTQLRLVLPGAARSTPE